MPSENSKEEASRRGRGLLASLVSIVTLLALILAGCSSLQADGGVSASLAQVRPASRLAGQPGPGGGAGQPSHSADPIQVQGSIQRLSGSALQGTWQVSGLAVQVTAATSLDQRAAPAAPGAEVEVHGWLQPDGSLQADWIRVLSPARPIADASPSPLRIILPTQGLAAAGTLAGSGQGLAPVTEAGIVPSRIPETGIHADSPGLTGWLALKLHYAWVAESFAHSPQRSGPVLSLAAGAVGGQAAAGVANAAGAAPSQVQPVANVQPAAQPQPAVFHPPAPPPVQAPPPIVVIVPPIVVPPVVVPPAPPPVVAPPAPQPAPPPVVAPPPAPQPPPGHAGGGDGGGSGKDHKGKSSKDGGSSGQGGGDGKGKGPK